MEEIRIERGGRHQDRAIDDDAEPAVDETVAIGQVAGVEGLERGGVRNRRRGELDQSPRLVDLPGSRP
ncbi:MAG: hypothetical protein WB809_00225 [Thermoplasmata archaeon]